ncbi:MAG: hypothetical protein K0R65_3009 [Crocinitomicaceae bacterium]|jgi:ELWxxDGT repeat protein|nr:hypothetical protein [Crocinitomicaceae bacterium]
MKKNILTSVAALTCLSALNAQSLFKDLVPGAHPMSSSIEEFMNVNGTLFMRGKTMIAGSSAGIHKLWKSDGTAENTVLVKDSVAVTATGGMKFCANINGTLYYIVSHTASFSATTSTELWKTDGGTPVLVTTLSHQYGTGGGGSPRNFVAVGDKLFFNMGQSNGRELWVSDGTAAGTVEVTDLAPGEIVPGVDYNGLQDEPMVAFNGKVYFSGTATGMDPELYSSDGTAAGTTLVHEIAGPNSMEPHKWLVHNNTLFFIASDGNQDNLWKTDGTTALQLTTSPIGVHDLVVFDNKVHFIMGSAELWSTDGTVAGTTLISAGSGYSFKGANSDYLFTSSQRTDGTTALEDVSAALLSHASFVVLDNNMYTSVLNQGTFTATLWESDGTDAGTTGLITGYVGNPFVFNNTVFFTNHDNDNGYELWTLDGSQAAITETEHQQISVYPNPSGGIFNVKTGDTNASFNVHNTIGETVHEQQGGESIDLSALPKGIYFLDIIAKGIAYTQKIILQ